MTTKVALYCRVSTSSKDQTTENQRLELETYCDRMGYEVVKVYEDEVSGAKSREKRPAYSELIKDAFLKKFDIIIGWDVSRFGRSMKEFVHFLSDMDDKGIGVIAVIEDADGTGVACLADNGDHGCLVLAFAEGKNFWLRALVHAVEVKAMEVGLYEL